MTQTPIMALFREWKAAYDTLCSLNVDESAEGFEYTYTTDEMRNLERQIMAVESVNLGDLAAKILAKSHYGDFCLDRVGAAGIFNEARAFVGGGE